MIEIICFIGNFLFVMLIFLIFVFYIMGIVRNIFIKEVMNFCILLIVVIGMMLLIIGGGGVFK